MATKMIEQKAADVYFDTEDAILNEEFPGFKEDYLVLHSLIRKYRPKTFFEIGTNCGTGTNIICNAVKKYFINGITIPDDNGNAKPIDRYILPVYSLDLPTELAHISLQHPISEGKGDKVGAYCKFPYTQLRGDSLKFNFSDYPCEGYFIDGEHDQDHVFHEARQALSLLPKIIIFHDSDIKEVGEGILKAINGFENTYDLFRVTDTRIAYALRK